MSANLVPSDPQAAALAPQASAGYRSWEDSAGAGTQTAGVAEMLSRSVSAIWRYKWLVLAIVVSGTSVGYALTRMVKPKYDVNGRIWVAKNQSNNGPITTPGLISDALSWTELVRAGIVLDQVVAKHALWISADVAADSVVLRGMQPSPALVPGGYQLTTDASGATYRLLRRAGRGGGEDVEVERGTVGDSVGRSVGLLWQPSPEALGASRTVSFNVVTPREASLRLNRDLTVGLPQTSNVMTLILTGEQPGKLAATMNTLMQTFVSEAGRLKQQNLSAVARTVEEQLQQAKEQLERASSAYERFKVNTITLPSENTVVAPGVAMATNPVFQQFFQDNITYKALARDRAALERILEESGAGGRLSVEALRTLPIVQSNPELQGEITNLTAAQLQLRQQLRVWTDSGPPVVALRQYISQLETQTIPQLARIALEQLRVQEADVQGRIAGQATELQQIPQRTIEEASRQREVSIADRIYSDLQGRAASARLAEMSAMPDVSILDPAVPPLNPSSDTALGIFLVAIAASIGLALFVALLLDRMDKRFRYPEQATTELGLDIVGAIPTLTNPRNSSARLQEASQLVESFRSLSLTVRSAFDGLGPVQLTISSPGPGDGKSFISANLASALADGGFRTVLVDGDIRRGALHSVFAPMTQTPGLLEYLAGDAAMNEIVRSTGHRNLFVIPCGKRRRHGPELLAGDGMVGLIRDLRGQFDAVIVDSAPLGAGIDPFALGVATGAMLIVLRTGETDRKLAQAKLEVLDRMPVRILGTVLNDIGENPQFKYYYYLEGYGAESAEEAQALVGSGTSTDR